MFWISEGKKGQSLETWSQMWNHPEDSRNPRIDECHGSDPISFNIIQLSLELGEGVPRGI